MFTYMYSMHLLLIATLKFLALLPSIEETIDTITHTMSVHVPHGFVTSSNDLSSIEPTAMEAHLDLCEEEVAR